jgi:deoxyribonuclease-1
MAPLFISSYAFLMNLFFFALLLPLSALTYDKVSLRKIHSFHPYTLYCGCRYEGKKVDLQSCGYKIIKNKRRAQRVEWEHVVPAHAFGQAFLEWREGSANCIKKNGRRFKGRKCAQTNAEFQKMESDMYNIYPEIGELNGLRSNYSMAAITGKRLEFGDCKAAIQERKFEPMDVAKGVVSRTYMYMDATYPGRGIISDKNRKLFEAWNKMYPAADWECERARRIESLQRTPNLVVKQACAALTKAP